MIRRTTLSNKTWVSTIERTGTVLLIDSVLDKIVGREDLPFETMVFKEENYPKEESCQRWPDRASAIGGHNATVSALLQETGVQIVEEEKDAGPQTTADILN